MADTLGDVFPRRDPDPQLKLPGLPPGLYHAALADHVVRGDLRCDCPKGPRPCACPCDCGNVACGGDDVCCWCLWADEVEHT